MTVVLIKSYVSVGYTSNSIILLIDVGGRSVCPPGLLMDQIRIKNDTHTIER